MAYTQQDLDEVRKAIAGSQLEVQYGDKRVRYRTTAELLAAEQRIMGALRAARRRSPFIRVRHAGKGV
jgi:hypothetical protein